MVEMLLIVGSVLILAAFAGPVIRAPISIGEAAAGIVGFPFPNEEAGRYQPN